MGLLPLPGQRGRDQPRHQRRRPQRQRPAVQSAYVTLLRNIRAKYPNATIFALETFRKRYVAETQAAVAAVGDSRVRFVNTEGWINEATDTVDNVHPNDAGHRKIADRLVPLLG